MEYRSFGRTDWQGSALGFGAMRLPLLDKKASNIDEPLVKKMIGYAIEHGVNYIDTAYPYHEGQGEPCLGRVLKEDGYRDKVWLATKMPSWFIQDQGDFDRYLNEQLERLQTERIDCYLLHGLNRELWPKLRNLGVLKWAEGAITDGRIHHFGFSFHDDLPTFKGIIDDYDKWTLCQIQYNFMDIEFQAGREGLKYAADKGLAVVVMEPLRGGQLAKDPPRQVKELLVKAPGQRGLVEWALQWLWKQPEVSLLLSGMSAMEQVEENVACAECSITGALTKDEFKFVDLIRDAYRGTSPIPCTSCKYCMPCPNGVNIPGVFEVYNEAFIYDDRRKARLHYRQLKAEDRADRCTECGECEDLCPQDIPITEWLKKVDEFFAPRKT